MAEIWLRKRKNGWNLIKKEKKRLKFDEICSNAFKFDQIHSNSWCTWWTNLIRMHSNQIGIFTKQNLSFVIWFTIQLNIVSISKWMCTFFSGKHYEELFNFFRLIATIIQKCYGEVRSFKGVFRTCSSDFWHFIFVHKARKFFFGYGSNGYVRHYNEEEPSHSLVVLSSFWFQDDIWVWFETTIYENHWSELGTCFVRWKLMIASAKFRDFSLKKSLWNLNSGEDNLTKT